MNNQTKNTVKDAIEQFGDEWYYQIYNRYNMLFQEGRIEDLGDYMDKVVEEVHFTNFGDIECQLIKRLFFLLQGINLFFQQFDLFFLFF